MKYIAIILFLIISNFSLSQTLRAKPEIFEAAFSDTIIVQGTTEYELKKLDYGMINIESGKIIACDPIVMNSRKPFSQTFPIGEFPVQLGIALTDNDGVRAAFSQIQFSYNKVEKWEYALLPGQKNIDIFDSVFYCFSVDAGLAIFIDEQANVKFNKKGHSKWKKVFVDIATNRSLGYVYRFGKHNLAFFPTGYGDGCYATYVGYDKNGKICRLLIDFAIIEWWEEK